MNVLCDDMEEIGFRDGKQQRRAKPSGTWLIDLVRVMAATDEDRLILMFSQTDGCEKVFWILQKHVRGPLINQPAVPFQTDVPLILLFSSNLHTHQVKHGCSLFNGPSFLWKTDPAHTFLSNMLLVFLCIASLTPLAPRLRPKFCLPLCPVGRLFAPFSLRAEDWNIVLLPGHPHCDELQEIREGPWQADYQAPLSTWLLSSVSAS